MRVKRGKWRGNHLSPIGITVQASYWDSSSQFVGKIKTFYVDYNGVPLATKHIEPVFEEFVDRLSVDKHDALVTQIVDQISKQLDKEKQKDLP